MNTATAANGVSPRERDVLLRLARGEAPSQVARGLGVSETTVERYLARVREKLDARTTVAAVVIALRRGLLTLDEVAA